MAATTGGTETPTCRANGPLRARTLAKAWSRGSWALRAPGLQTVGGQPGCCEKGPVLLEQLRAPRWEWDAGASTSWKAALNSPRFQPVPLEKFLPALQPRTSAELKLCRGCSSGPILGGWGAARALGRRDRGPGKAPSVDHPPPGQRSNRGPGRGWWCGRERQRSTWRTAGPQRLAGTATCN